jgi:hypothetical protein
MPSRKRQRDPQVDAANAILADLSPDIRDIVERWPEFFNSDVQAGLSERLRARVHVAQIYRELASVERDMSPRPDDWAESLAVVDRIKGGPLSGRVRKERR